MKRVIIESHPLKSHFQSLLQPEPKRRKRERRFPAAAFSRLLPSILLASTFASSALADVFSNVPAGELSGYSLVYDLNIPNAATWNGTSVPYSVDNHASINTSWDRVAYYLELGNGVTTTWAYASMDPFGAGIGKIGVPNTPATNYATIFQRNVTNLNVYASSGSGIVTGTSLSTGNIEFFSANYNEVNLAAVPNASGTIYDHGDRPAGPIQGYGSLQIHNHTTGTTPASQTIVAYNHWGTGGATASDIGIGNNPNGAQGADWTFAQNAASFSVKRLQVLVRPSVSFTDPTTLTSLAAGYQRVYATNLPGLNQMQGLVNGVTFSNGAPYQVDRPEAISGPISRVGYLMELHKTGDPAGQNQYVFASMDAFTQDLKKIGIPTLDTGAFFQQNVTNLSVDSNVLGVVKGVNLGTGNIEFWPSDYGAPLNAASPANASGTLYDFGDSGGNGTTAGHGSFQLHNFDIDGTGPGTTGQTVFSISRFNATTAYGIGIGNSPTTNPDWTFNDNSVVGYDLRSVQVFVLPVPEPSSAALMAVGALLIGRRRRQE
jgi:hypothetical protein